MQRSPRMGEGFSLYLDAVRLGAALLVLLHHFSARSEFSGGFLWQFRGFGLPAVMVFFVLSGFVIAYVSLRPGYGARQFAAERTARIMSVAVPAVLLTFVLDYFGQPVRPELYAAAMDPAHPPAVQALAALLFLNESWFGHIGVGSDTPYWSLPYEVWYYVAFGLALYAPGRWRWFGPVLALAVAGPSIVTLAPVWVLGCAVYWLGPRLRIRPALAGFVLLATLLGGLGLGLGLNWAGQHWGEALDWRAVTAIALGVAVNFIAAWHAEPLLDALFRPVAGLVRLSARMTFTLYLTHLPLMFFLRAFAPWPSTSWTSRVVVLAGPVVAAALLTVVTDRLQSGLRRALRGQPAFAGTAGRVRQTEAKARR